MADASDARRMTEKEEVGARDIAEEVDPAGMTEEVESRADGELARARETRQIEARAALRPLGPHERPAALRIAITLALALALGVLLSVITVHDLARHGGSLPGGLFLTGVLLLLAWGMYERRYWAVLGFEALLAFQVIVTSLALIVAETLIAAGLCVLSIGLAGWLFWKLVRVMGRMQARDLASAATKAETDEALR
jgi:hypothetical protein